MKNFRITLFGVQFLELSTTLLGKESFPEFLSGRKPCQLIFINVFKRKTNKPWMKEIDFTAIFFRDFPTECWKFDLIIKLTFI